MIARPVMNQTEMGPLATFRAPADSSRLVSRRLQPVVFEHSRNELERVAVPLFLDIPLFLIAVEPEDQPDGLDPSN
jgi:hypothetical protein